MFFLGHWWILVLIIAAAVLLISGPRLLPKLGSFMGRRGRELKGASMEAGTKFKEEVTKPTDSPEPENSEH
jgi:Sec-independent protein translocase protein TatA